MCTIREEGSQNQKPENGKIIRKAFQPLKTKMVAALPDPHQDLENAQIFETFEYSQS